MKKLLSLILSLLMVFGVFFASAVSVNAGTNPHPWYEVYPKALNKYWRFSGYASYLFYIDDSGATMLPHESFNGTAVNVPEWVYNPRGYDDGGYYPDFPVAGVTGFENYDSIVSLSLNSKRVDSKAFKNCTNLKTINIWNNLISIYDEAFDGCYSLEKVTFSYTPNLVSFDKGAFRKCSNLTGFYNDNDNSICVLDDLYYIGEEAFMGCLKLTDFCCPNVNEIGQNAFKGCESLKSFVFSDNIKEIKNGVFDGCSSLRQAYLSESITSIGERAFADSGIYKLYIPANVTEIADDAFSGTPLSMIYGENGSYAEAWAIAHNIPFCGAYEYSVNADDTVTITKCNLDTIRAIPTTLGGRTVTRIGNSAFQKVKFYECGPYTSPLTLNADIKYIGEYAFSECIFSEIKNLYAQTIEANAFYGCFYLTSIEAYYDSHHRDVIDAGSIGDMAFYNCNLESMTFSRNIATIGSKAIGYTAGKKIDGFTIYGYSNTVAKTYADENGFNFVPLDNFYDLWVGSTRVSDVNCEDILGDGTARFDSETNTLTLNNAKITDHYADGDYTYAIYSKLTSDLTVKGSGKIGTTATRSGIATTASGLILDGDFTITGSEYGVSSMKGVTFSSGSTTVNGTVVGVLGPVTISAQISRLEVTGSDYAVGSLAGIEIAPEISYILPENGMIKDNIISDKDGNLAPHVILEGKPSVLLGDADTDGEVTIFDATAIQRYLAQLSVTKFSEDAADADEDGDVTIFDATAIQRYLAQLPTNPNIGKNV